jgi:ferredoxin/flavodoxin---NADP+ reductase
MSKWVNGEIIAVKWWTPTLFSIKVAAQLEPYKAGQFTKLALDVAGKRYARAYSFVNAPNDSIHEFYLVEVPNGKLTPSIAKLKQGDELQIEYHAHGFFTLDDIPKANTLWLFSSGTAIGPFLSIISDDQLWGQFDEVVLVHSVRMQAELAYVTLIQQTQKKYPQFKYLPLITRETTDFGLNRRLTQLIKSGEFFNYFSINEFSQESQFMICGNPQMVKDITAILLELGFKRNRRSAPGHITVELYW